MKSQLRSLYLILLATFSVLCGCDFYGDKQRSWTEDVALDDGTQVRIRRHVEFTDHNSLARDTYGAFETKATLEFIGGFPSAPPVWDVPLIPLVLYRDAAASEWVLVATVSMCETWEERGRPMSPYWEFRSDGGPWRSADLSSHSIGRSSNLFFRYHSGVPSSHLTTDEKTKIVSDSISAPKYRQILSADQTADYCGGVPHQMKREDHKN